MFFHMAHKGRPVMKHIDRKAFLLQRLLNQACQRFVIVYNDEVGFCWNDHGGVLSITVDSISHMVMREECGMMGLTL